MHEGSGRPIKYSLHSAGNSTNSVASKDVELVRVVELVRGEGEERGGSVPTAAERGERFAK